MATATRSHESIATGTLFMSFELSDRHWQLTVTTSLGARRVRRTMAAWGFAALQQVLVKTKQVVGLPADAPVRSCYEAGREGFALHRWLSAHAVENVVIDPTSLRVDRRARRVKTDRVDGDGLLTALLHFTAGDKDAFRIVRVPSRDQEAGRHPHRELATLTREKTRATNQIQSLLLTQGIRLRLDDRFPTRLLALRDWAGEPLPTTLQVRLTRIWARRVLITAQIRELEHAITAAVAQDGLPGAAQIRDLQRLRGIGLRGSVTVTQELLWRQFRNRREVGGYLGVVNAPYQSGDQARDQGITKHGNRHARRVMIPLAWGWLRYQPDSALSRWFTAHCARGSDRDRRIAIVALARRLAIALWRFVTAGVIPEGAQLKA